MTFRFHKRVKIFPGVRLNFSKGGVSTTVGVRGAGVTFTKNGTYANVGLPGSGMSYRTRIDKLSGNSSSAAIIEAPVTVESPTGMFSTETTDKVVLRFSEPDENGDNEVYVSPDYAEALRSLSGFTPQSLNEAYQWCEYGSRSKIPVSQTAKDIAVAVGKQRQLILHALLMSLGKAFLLDGKGPTGSTIGSLISMSAMWKGLAIFVGTAVFFGKEAAFATVIVAGVLYLILKK